MAQLNHSRVAQLSYSYNVGWFYPSFSKNREWKKMVPRSPGWFSQLSWERVCLSVGPPPVGNGDVVVFGPFWASGTQRNSGPGRKRPKTQFPGARGTFGVEIRTPQKCLTESAQLFYILCFDRPDPHGQEIAEYWFFRPFWPRAALGTKRNPGPGPKTGKRNFPGPFLGGDLAAHKVSPRNSATGLRLPKRDKPTPFSWVLIPSLAWG